MKKGGSGPVCDKAEGRDCNLLQPCRPLAACTSVRVLSILGITVCTANREGLPDITMPRERHTVPLHPCARCGFAFSSEDRGRTRGELRKRLPLAHPRLCRLLGVCMCIAAIRSLPCTRDVRGRVPVRLGEQGVVDRGIRCGFARTETLEEVAKGRVVREGSRGGLGNILAQFPKERGGTDDLKQG